MKRAVSTLLIISAVATFAAAERYEIRRDSVLEATSDQDLSMGRTREGDRFTVTLRDGRDVPRGTQLEGEVVRVEPKRGDQPGYMDLQFTSLLTQDGQRHRISALPISLDDRKIRRDRDGRMTADSRKHRSEHYVFGGMVGGLVVGSLLKKPFEGAFVGTLAGIIFSELERDRGKKSGDLVMRRGSKLGVLFANDVRFDADDRYGRYDDRRDDTRRDDDRWNDRRDDDRWGDEGWNDDRRDTRDQIEYDGRPIRSSGTFIRERGATLVPLSTARDLGIEVEQSGSRIYLDFGDKTVRLTVGSADYRYDGTTGRLPAEVRSERNEIYVPIEALAAVLPRPLKVNGIIVRRPA